MIGITYYVLEHESINWIDLDEFKNYEFAPADVYFVNEIVKKLS